MKEYIKKLSRFFIVPFLLIILLLFFHTKLPLMSDFDYDGGLKLKHQLLEKNINEKKIIFIGGSNLTMGLNSEKIQQTFQDYQIINYGHRFQYGLKFYLSEIKPFLNENDIVVLVPEYQIILEDFFGNQQLAKVKIENLNYSSDTEIQIYPRDFFDYIKMRIDFLIKLKIGSFPNNSNHNRITAFNKFGDCTAHWYFNHKNYDNYLAPKEIKFNDYNYYKKFNDYCSEKGIVLLLTPPMYDENSFGLSRKLVQENIKYWQFVGLNYAYPPEKMVLSSKYFYDTPYHLLYSGVQIKTNLIISIIEAKNKERTVSSLHY